MKLPVPALTALRLGAALTLRTALTLGGTALTLGVAPAMAGTLTVCLEGSPEVFNPHLSSSGTTATVLGQIYDTLVEVAPGGSTIEPSLAESWEVSADGKDYTFHLRKDVAWQANADFTPSRPFNADDVLFTFQRMMDPGHPYHEINGGNYITFATKLADAIDSVEKRDDYTVVFHLKAPLAPFIGIMSHGSIAMTSAEYADVLLKAGKPEQFDREPIGTGPFQLQAYQSDSIVRLLPFAGTWGVAAGKDSAMPKVDAIIMAISPDASVRVQRALAGECGIAFYPNLTDAPQIEASEKLDLVHVPIPSTGFISFNFGLDKFKDLRVRQALGHAINMDALVEVVFSGLGKPTGSVIPASLWGHADDLKPYSYDPALAKKLLAEAGYPDGLSTELWAIPVARPYMPNGRRAAEMVQADWAAIGVKAEIVSYEWAEYIQRARNHEAEVAMFGGTWDFPDPSQIPNNYFTCDSKGVPSPSNVGSWCDPDFNAVMAKAGAISDQAERAKLYDEAQHILYDQVPAVMFGGSDQLIVVSKDVKGYVPAVFGTGRMSGVSVD
ncbi:ABC transporter substrate-binding protein [Paracoccus aminophilus]|uniref:ABC-type dipeptide transport system, periplasmic component n=1 Tax=Paracoccus aminophilus JCM 7686 TaxID=1367847 RepID=S5YHI7_PARAH|nr:ABC transporter substrate-binding protein [Paracoccus aminophilus]AGT10923.1 ABC-type dipeptide transport system, periplasmic component [Paracoccus aminophilus JCM 7686]